MRIVHGLHWSGGGIVNFIDLLLSNINTPDIEHHVVILNSDMASNHQLRNKSISYSFLGFENNQISGLIRFVKIIKSIKPDIFHAHSFLPGVIGRLFSSEKTICIATIHNEYPHYTNNSCRNKFKLKLEYKSLKRSCKAVVCVSESVRQRANDAMPGLPFEVINNGIQLGMMRDASTQQKKEYLTILSLGRLDEQKGYDVLLEAFSILHKKGIKAYLRIVGEGSLRPTLEAKAKELGIDKKVFMPGFSQNPISELSNADMYVCSSRYEGLSLATAEAMAFGLPLITTNVGGVALMVHNGVEARVVPMNNPVALAYAIIEFIENPCVRFHMSVAGREFARKNFDIRNTSRSYEMLYKRLLKN